MANMHNYPVVIAQLEEEIKRFSAENAGLREDRERLDWIDANLGAFEQMLNDDDNLQLLEVDLRMAIDAARGAK